MKTYDGKGFASPNLPDVKQILYDFEQARGNVSVFLDQVCSKPEESARERVLYAVLAKIQADEEACERWEQLKAIGNETVATMLHARLLKLASSSEAPKEIVMMLERLSPETWGKKSVNSPKNPRGIGNNTKVDELLREFE